MKKLAALLALVLTCNLFTAFSVNAEDSGLHKSFDFEDMTAFSFWGKNDDYPDGANIPSPDSAFVIGGGNEVQYAKVDTEHGISFAHRGNNYIKYVFPSAVVGKASFSFDLRISTPLTDGDNWWIWNGYVSWDPEEFISGVYGESFKAGSWDDKGTVKAGTWHRVDLEIDGTESSSSVKVYLDGVYKGKRDFSRSLDTLLLKNNGNDKGFVYIDNIRVEYPQAGTAKMTASYVDTGSVYGPTTTESYIRMSDTLDRTIFDEDVLAGEVTETNLEDGTTRELEDVEIDIDTTSTKLKVIYNETLNNNCKYTIKIPSGLKGLFGETEVTTESVEFTTLRDGEFKYYSNNFNTMTATYEGYKSNALPSGFGGSDGTETWVGRVDYDHGVSYGTNGSKYMTFDFGSVINGTARYSFDLLVTGSMASGKGWYIWNGTPNWGNNSAGYMAHMDSQKFDIDWHTKKSDIEANKWYRVDLIITGTESSASIDFYFDGTKIGTYSNNKPLQVLGFMNNGRTNSDPWVFIDNVKAAYPASISDLITTEVAGATDVLADDTTFTNVHFSDYVTSTKFVNGSKVEVEETNLTTEETRKLENATGTLDSTGTLLKVTYGEKLNPNCKYTITVPNGFEGLTGGVKDNQTVEIKTFATPDVYETFDNYNVGDNLNTVSVSKDKNDSNAEIAVVDGAYGVGKAVSATSWGGNVKYTLPAIPRTGKMVFSWDWKRPESVAGATQLTFYDDLGQKTASHYVLEWAGGGISDGYTWGSFGTHENNTWAHYDIVIDYDKQQSTLYYNGEALRTNKEFWVKQFVFGADGKPNATQYIDNVHVRRYGENEVTTNLQGTMSTKMTKGRVDFKDAVDPTSIDVTIMGTVPFGVTLENVTPYGADVVFDEALEADEDYIVTIDAKSYSGEALENDQFTFTATDADTFEVTSVSVVNDDAEVTSAASWNKEADYDIKAVVNTTIAEGKEFQVIVAGYTTTGLVQVKAVTLTATGSGTYSADLGKVDMKGATTIKCFAIDKNMAPVMNKAKSF